MELDEDETADARSQVEGLLGKVGIVASAIPSSDAFLHKSYL